MRTRLTAFALVALAAVAVASAQQDRRPDKMAPTRERSTYNYVKNHAQGETDYQSEKRAYSSNVHGYKPRQDKSAGSHLRYGYASDHRFDKNEFGFSAYLYTPFGASAYPSPWYYYPELPPYVSASLVTVDQEYSFSWNQGNAYTHPGSGRSDDPGLDGALEALQHAFSNHDSGAVSEMIDPAGKVAIYQDGHYEYSLRSIDFQSMVADNLNNVDTTSFTVDKVSHWNSQAIVHATQVVTNPDGNSDSIMLMFHLERHGDRFFISDMSTSRG